MTYNDKLLQIIASKKVEMNGNEIMMIIFSKESYNYYLFRQ